MGGRVVHYVLTALPHRFVGLCGKSWSTGSKSHAGGWYTVVTCKRCRELLDERRVPRGNKPPTVCEHQYVGVMHGFLRDRQKDEQLFHDMKRRVHLVPSTVFCGERDAPILRCTKCNRARAPYSILRHEVSCPTCLVTIDEFFEVGLIELSTYGSMQNT